jgi:hypothetical protein
MHTMVVSTYTNFFLAIASYIAIAASGLSLSYFKELSALSWTMACLIAVLTIGE